MKNKHKKIGVNVFTMSCKLKLCTGVKLLATVIVLVAVLCMLWTLPNSYNSHCKTLCLPCDPSASNDRLCCDCETSSLNSYLQQVVIRRYGEIQREEERESKKNYREPSIRMKQFLEKTRWAIKPAARFTGTVPPKSRIYDKDMVPIRAWREGQRSYMRYGMRYRNGRIVVPIPGTYNIYSYLDLYETCMTKTNANHTKSGVITHDMVRYNILKSEEQILLSNVHAHEIPQNQHFNIYESYLAGVVELDAGDEVFVRISNLSYISSPSSNYFGIHMV